ATPGAGSYRCTVPPEIVVLGDRRPRSCRTKRVARYAYSDVRNGVVEEGDLANLAVNAGNDRAQRHRILLPHHVPVKINRVDHAGAVYAVEHEGVHVNPDVVGKIQVGHLRTSEAGAMVG